MGAHRRKAGEWSQAAEFRKAKPPGEFLTDQRLPTVFQTTALDPAGRANPHPRLDVLRSKCPIYFDNQLGGFFLTRYEDVRRVFADRTMLRDPAKSRVESRGFRKVMESAPEGSLDHGKPMASMMFLDDPDHSRLRAPLFVAMHKRIKEFIPSIRSIVEGRLDALAGSDGFDLVESFARLLPVEVIAGILGVEGDRIVEFRAWSEAAALSLHPMRSAADTAAMLEGQNQLHRYFLDLIKARRAAPGADLISDVLASSEGARISDHELQVNLRLLLIAGNMTTTDLIGNAMYLLLSNRTEYERLLSDLSLTPGAVEEALRMESPVDLTVRVAAAPTELSGCPIEQGRTLTLSLRAANRDGDEFPDPHRFSLDRKNRRHVAFGGGSHICLGAQLARLETAIAVESIARRFPNLRLADPDAAPAWRALPPFRGLTHLHVLA